MAMFVKSPTAIAIPRIDFDQLYPCRYEVMTFSEKELSNGWLNGLWGGILTYAGNGILGLAISAVEAIKLYNKARSERWSTTRLIDEVKKKSVEQARVIKVVDTVVGCLELLVAGAAALAGAFIPAIIFLVIALITITFGFTIGQFLQKRGFVRLVEGFTDIKLKKSIFG